MSLWTCGRFTLDLSRPRVMGILNLTPDSFSDGGRYEGGGAALAHAECMIAEGADVIDLGGESTRPGCVPVPLEIELARVLEVLALLRDAPVPISIDTYKPEVMRAALDAGASIVNDVYGFARRGSIEAVAGRDCGLVAMHMQGEPASMQVAPHYDDVVLEVKTFLKERLAALESAGVSSDRVVIDPGFGFGKTQLDNWTLLRELTQFTDVPCAGVLVGLSRKGMLGKVAPRPVRERLGSSVAVALLAYERGARIIRCHDVAATVDALKIALHFHAAPEVEQMKL